MGLINSASNGATEIPGTSNESLFVFLAGPIRYWWTPGVEGTRLHQLYMHAREEIHAMLSDEFLVYAPHRAWRGPWDERAQFVNDYAISNCDALVWLNAEVQAVGTDNEILGAKLMRLPVFEIKIGDEYSHYDQTAKLIPVLQRMKAGN